MKKILFLLLTMSFINLSFTNGDNSLSANEEKERIELVGLLKPKVPPKSGVPSISAFMDDEAIEIAFSIAYANLTIAIENSSGIVVYSNTINAAAGMIYPIDISLLPAGTYLLKISDAYGGSLSGYFKL